jgi:hypothetical protein
VGRVVRLGRQDVGGDADERGELPRRVGGEPEQAVCDGGRSLIGIR